MTLVGQAVWWGAGLLLLAFLLWVLSDALMPFVLGIAIAYFADPLADRLERVGFGRLWAVVVITVASLGVVVLTLVLLLPSLIQQVQALVRAFPVYFDQVRIFATEWLPEVAEENAILRQGLEALRENAEGWSGALIQRLLTGGLALLDFVLILVVTPVVAFYMLWDWDRMIATVDGWLPRQHRPTIHRLARDIDDVLAGFVRGQFTVCLILGSFYALALTFVGLEFGLLIGAFAGLISFIPYVGSVVGGVLSVGIAAVQFWSEPVWIVVVAAIFAAGQAVEGNVLTPNMVGGHVKLHPVWLMFALAAFGTTFGFVGLLVAVPVAAVIGVLGRFAIERYKAGPLYRGSEVVDRYQRIAGRRVRGPAGGVETRRALPGGGVAAPPAGAPDDPLPPGVSRGAPEDLDPHGVAEGFGTPAETLREVSPETAGRQERPAPAKDREPGR
ncbi:MAG TPA: AI-2E family transporter [Thermohalobaculum sp.]|nr:AI-2E family transporter [Thermohalobaculum sp.]